MGVPSIAAFALHAAGAGILAGDLSLTSAVLTMPVVALTFLEGR